MSIRACVRLGLAALAVAASVAVFLPVTRNFFHVDDFCHFFDAMDSTPARYVVQPWGGHVYLVRNALLWAMFHAFGMEAGSYFVVILVLHGLNVALLFLLLRRWTGSAAVAAVVATAWGVCPLHGATLGWLAVMGQVLLSTVFLTLVLTLDGDASPGRTVLSAVLAFLGSVCVGMGLAVVLLLPLLAALVGPGPRGRAAVALWAAPVAALGTYVAVRALVPSPIGAFVDAAVSPGAALRAWRYVLAMWGWLVPYGGQALVLGFFDTDVPFSGPWRWALDGVLAGVAVLGLVRTPPVARRRIVAAASVSLVAYALVAAGRAPFYETADFPPLRAAVTARYHYFPTLGIAIVLALACGALVSPRRRRWELVAVAAWVAVAALGFRRRPPWLDHYDAERRETTVALYGLRTRVGTQPPGVPVVVPVEPFGPAARVPCEVYGTAGLYLMAWGTSDLYGHTVRFAVPQATLEKARADGGRVVSLLVPSGR